MDASRLEQGEPVTDGFRRLCPEDREPLLAIAAQVWEGHDYLPHVFDAWVADADAYFAGMFVGGQLVGCGRFLPLDDRRVWLEALRVDPARHGQGLGRRMSAHIAGAALARGFRELFFATYFDNQASIRISEASGFRRIATFTHLEAEDLGGDGGTGEESRAAGAPSLDPALAVTASPGVPDAEGYLVNDWFFVPPGVPDRSRFFPDALTLTHGESRILIARNEKYPRCLEICWRQAPAGRLSATCLEAARDHARRRACTSMHTMLPEGHAIDPYREAGFAYFEQEGDTYLYAARAEDLRL